MANFSYPVKSKSQSILCIVIPTFNRAIFLDQCLAFVVEAIGDHLLPIYISDNCSSDNTAEIVEKWRTVYPLIHYSSHEENLGPDRNFENALKMGQSDYVWLLGDTYRITSSCVDFLVDLFLGNSLNPDIVILNAADRVKDVPSTVFTDANELLNCLGWHMTCMSSLIYKSNMLAQASYARFRSTDFVQLGIIFESIENRSFSAKWVVDQSVYPIEIPGRVKNGWRPRIFQVWVERWSNVVMSLPPSYCLATKLKCIKAHNSKSGLFSIESMLSLRADGILSWANMSQFPCYLAFSPMKLIAARAIGLMPTHLARMVCNGIRWLRACLK